MKVECLKINYLSLRDERKRGVNDLHVIRKVMLAMICIRMNYQSVFYIHIQHYRP